MKPTRSIAVLCIVLSTTAFAQLDSNATLVGHWMSDTSSWCIDVTTANGYAYVLDAQAGGLRIIDVIDPTSPQEVGFISADSVIGGGPLDQDAGAVVIDTCAYLVSGNSLQIIDVSDPANPTDIGHHETDRSVHDIAVDGSYAYLASGDSLIIIDVSDPANPLEISGLEVVSGNFSSEGAVNVSVSGGYAYVSRTYWSVMYYDDLVDLYIVDVTDVENPQSVAGCHLVDGSWARVCIQEHYVYAVTYWAIYIIDRSDPSNPNELFSSWGLYPAGFPASDIAVSGNYAYVAGAYNGLRILDVGNPSNPHEVGFYHTVDEARGVSVDGSLIYVADRQGGLYIIQNDFLVDVDNVVQPAVAFELGQNYPNPFNPITSISYDLPWQSDVILTVYDMQGREVKSLQNQSQPAGHHKVRWNGVDDSGNPVSTGLYFARLLAGDYSMTIKMVYLE